MTKSFNNWDKVAKALRPAAKAVVKKTAFDAEGYIKAKIVENDQIDTSFMLNSVYTVTSEKSTYQGGEKALPQVQAPSRDTEAFVAVAAEYAIFQNYGTKLIAGRPFFEPGIERVRAGFDKAMEAIRRKMEGAARP